MIWYNYKVFTVNTPLSGNAIVTSDSLKEFIEHLGANTSLYHSYYDLEKRTNFVDYQGLIKPVFDTIHIDLDSKEDEGREAWEDTKKLCKKLTDENVPFHLYFSGNKGFHVAIHMTAIGILDAGPKEEIEAKVKATLIGLQAEYPSVDRRIWDSTRKFRAFRSQHEKSGLYKIRLTKMGLSLKDMSIDAIRNLAIKPPENQEFLLPEPNGENAWLMSVQQAGSNTTTNPGYSKGKTIKEVSQGTKVEDDSLKFRNFKDKKCIRQMEETQLPQFNRHDIGLRLMCDLWAQGLTLEETKARLEKWAQRVFSGDRDRVSDTLRQVGDVYSRPQDYQFSCYDDIKSAYCSAKCKIYDQLDRKRRPEPVDATTKQRRENRIRENENLELSEGQIADKIISQMPELCKASGQYFQWNVNHWKRIDGPMFEDLVKKAAIAAYQNEAGIRQIDNLAKHILTKIPMAPETNHFFSASNTKFNFSDGTAEVIANEKGELKLVFKKHDSKDYLSYCAPFPLYGEHGLKRGTEFTKYMETRRADVGEEGVRIIKQMLGASLIPYVPRIFFIEGQSNAGKSTLALLIKRLLGQENVSEVQPVIHGNGGDRFNWEPSIGRLANIVLELDERKPLDTTVLKMVRDKAKLSVDRKGKGHVQATLPFFHVYCCNTMPPSLEGNSGALNNRVTMLHFKPGYLNGSSGIAEYAEYIWQEDPGGVLDMAREGLQDLIATGFKYFESDASRDAVNKWQKRTDSIALFFEDLGNSEWDIASLEKKEWEKGSVIYDSFVEWCSKSGRRQLGKHAFYDQLRKKHGVPCQVEGKGGVRFKGSFFVKTESDQKPTQKTLINSDTQAF